MHLSRAKVHHTLAWDQIHRVHNMTSIFLKTMMMITLIQDLVHITILKIRLHLKQERFRSVYNSLVQQLRDSVKLEIIQMMHKPLVQEHTKSITWSIITKSQILPYTQDLPRLSRDSQIIISKCLLQVLDNIKRGLLHQNSKTRLPQKVVCLDQHNVDLCQINRKIQCLDQANIHRI